MLQALHSQEARQNKSFLASAALAAPKILFGRIEIMCMRSVVGVWKGTSLQVSNSFDLFSGCGAVGGPIPSKG